MKKGDLGVKFRERKPRQRWVFVTHKKHRMAKLAGNYETAAEAKQHLEKQIVFGLYRTPEKQEKRAAKR